MTPCSPTKSKHSGVFWKHPVSELITVAPHHNTSFSQGGQGSSLLGGAFSGFGLSLKLPHLDACWKFGTTALSPEPPLCFPDSFVTLRVNCKYVSEVKRQTANRTTPESFPRAPSGPDKRRITKGTLTA